MEFLENLRRVLDLFPHDFAHIDWGFLQRGHRQAIARACVEFHDLALLEFVLGGDDQAAVENPAFEIIDDDPLDLAAESREDIREQVVSKWTLFLRVVQIEVDGMADRLVDVDGKNLFVVSQKNGCSGIRRDQRANLNRYHGLAHGPKLPPRSRFASQREISSGRSKPTQVRPEFSR